MNPNQKSVNLSDPDRSYLFDLHPDALVVVDPSGIMTDINTAAEVLSGKTRADLIGKSIFDLSPRQLADQTLEKMALTLATGELQLLEFPLDVSENSRLFEARLVPAPRSGVICFIREVTDRKMIEAEFLESEKSRVVGQIAGGVAHYFNNLLAVTLGASEILQDSIVEGQRDRELIQVILKASEKGAGLTEKLLAFAMKGKFRKKVFTIREIFCDFPQIVEASSRGNVDLKIEDASSDSMIFGDPVQIRQAFFEIVRNAVDAMPAGGVLVVKAFRQNFEGHKQTGFSASLTPGAYLGVEVSDSGMGIPEEHIERVYEPFFTTRLIQGRAGMGLPAARGIVRNHGGELKIDSMVGAGTTVAMVLPIYEGRAAQDEIEVSGMSKGRTILLADDEDFVRETMAIILESMGYRVIKCADGVEAVENFAVKKAEIDLVIIDYVMPRKSGVAAAREIKDIDPRARIIIASGYLPDGELKAMIDAGVADYIKKPCQRVQLEATVKKALGQT